MAFKEFTLDDGQSVTVYKRKASRSLRLSLAPNGQVRVSIPIWAPYSAGLNFARSRKKWIKANSHNDSRLEHGQPVGKAHHLWFVADAAVLQPSTRVRPSQIVVTYPAGLGADHNTVQKAAQTASIRALRQQAEKLLPERLASLAAAHGFGYGSLSIKRLKSRWGSCDQKSNIVLNLFLMQLPWELIDYVLLHELTHTRVLRHGPDFWRELEAVLPKAQALRRSIRQYQPVLHSFDGSIVA